ncbi:hypothetical protein BXY58_2145 [Epilithonimonas arachidiradicis]|uniref:Uncharacterized protein n=1 Tax=Epilithonimonas arachidiradicis TaxID=1617282 RepID=A0A420D8U3_9FLAO|nr:hypothetical protein BXY58_2145 [Epilithonimonas arachidiradicis]
MIFLNERKGNLTAIFGNRISFYSIPVYDDRKILL